MRLVLMLVALMAVTACAQPAPMVPSTEKPITDFSTPPETALDSVDQLLKAKGIPESDLKLIRESYIARQSDWMGSAKKILVPNIFGFLYHGDYMSHDSAAARSKIKRYLRSHQNSFRTAEKKYKVSAKSIAALLWVETKLGKTTGKHPVAWVYYSLSLASQPRFCSEILRMVPDELAKSALPSKPTQAEAEQKVMERCKTKSDWAMDELAALFELKKTHGLKPFQIRASFAGAFGIPQFIPTSYKKYAVSSFRKKPDLFLISDAILSVGHFLNQNGWKNDIPESQTAALYSYNRSRDYGMVITRIASELP